MELSSQPRTTKGKVLNHLGLLMRHVAAEMKKDVGFVGIPHL